MRGKELLQKQRKNLIGFKNLSGLYNYLLSIYCYNYFSIYIKGINRE